MNTEIKNQPSTFICRGCQNHFERRLIEVIKVEDNIMYPYCKDCSSKAFIW